MEYQTQVKAKLEEVMMAMDVVDTLRHDQALVARELDGEERRQRLLVRLRSIYSDQGIEVSDAILMQGIEALEQERFSYQPVPSSWRTKLATLWVTRARWSKPIGFLTVVAFVFTAIYVVYEVWPDYRLKANLPGQLASQLTSIETIAEEASVIPQAKSIAQQALADLKQDKLASAAALSAQLATLSDQLNRAYRVRIVSRPNENSGVWRLPQDNPNARNYYLIVEAVNDRNQILELDILNEENNQRRRQKTWGLRVSEQTFYQVAADKRDDGIIQNNIVGEKRRGFLRPRYLIETSGATITDWR